MALVDLFLAQIADPFRIGITVALMLTMLRTRANTGTILPLAVGVVFIAVLIPTVLYPGQGGKVTAIIVGLFSTGALLALAMLARTLVLRALGR